MAIEDYEPTSVTVGTGPPGLADARLGGKLKFAMQ